MTELYDDMFGIIDHDKETSPFSLVMQAEQENSVALVGYRNYVLEYLRCDILGKYGLSFQQWMKYPYYKRKELIDALEAFSKELPDQKKQLEQLQKDLAKLSGG
jgi:hypothetical protein